ncbi:hypothetical protein CDO44_15055 [Pigmentiphaga sp. NML080357]|uniref:MFS transporter n=1 Tax=Pigmentiphaga sp. NML080357 TaxID=2008675 RepID=UPI000B4111E2|nr:MFS transporter [Pigmentiphaga sp. NML080357]OVZ58296.1 hypothetical protein CDO44_15055 [Pigmentiphaga sp. NML080357]
MNETAKDTSHGSFAPLRQKLFAVLWGATVIGNTGSFIRDVASSWLMTDLSTSPTAVAMVQAAATLPVFLLAIPAGVLADILDRRKFLIAIQLLLAGVSVCLMLLTAWGMQTIGSLVALTFLGGVGAALLIGAAGLVIVGGISHVIKLPKGEADLVPSNHWPEPLTATPIENDRGPVLILVEYRIAPSDRVPFLQALERLSAERRRDGAYAWGVTEDAADPGLMLEWFQVESWAEHLRQHRRVSKADADVQEEVLRFHQGPQRPVVRHLLAVHGREPRPVH